MPCPPRANRPPDTTFKSGLPDHVPARVDHWLLSFVDRLRRKASRVLWRLTSGFTHENRSDAAPH